MDALIAEVKKAAATADDAGRQKLLDSLSELQLSIESPFDSIQRIAYSSLRLSVIRVGVSQGLFTTLASSDAPVSVQAMAEKVGAAPIMQARITRYLASIGMIQETGKNLFTANKLTKMLTDPGYEGAICHYFDTCGPCYQELPDYLAKTNYADITDAANTVFQKAQNTPVSGFAWFQQHPENLVSFNKWMAKSHGESPQWLSAFPLEKEVASWSAEPEKALFVDVGGGLGHQCAALKSTYPNIPGRVILQEIPPTLAQAQPIPGVEFTVQDFFTPNVISGAKFYYLRNILHDYPDESCVKILEHLVAAMDTDSRILIDDMVLPNEGVHWQTTQLDLTMMVCLASRERTSEEWDTLLDKVGLKIVNVYTYNPVMRDSVIMAMSK